MGIEGEPDPIAGRTKTQQAAGADGHHIRKDEVGRSSRPSVRSRYGVKHRGPADAVLVVVEGEREEAQKGWKEIYLPFRHRASEDEGHVSVGCRCGILTCRMRCFQGTDASCL